jgi:1,4-dihydroxy-6-naphthoate synthase
MADSALTTETKTLTLGHSPDPDDAFMFYALAEDKIDSRGWKFEHILQDIQTLNERAKREELDISAISIHAFAYVADKYALLSCGASMGENYGPMVVARESFPLEELKTKKIAVPGEMTSAFLALQLAIGKFEYEVVPFDQILDVVESGKLDAGLIIHEGQLTYGHQGLKLIIDLGQWWNERHGLPLPLGGNVVRRALGDEAIAEIADIMRESIQYGLEHRDVAVKHSMQWGRNLDQSLTDKFVGMYVNDRTIDYGEDGRRSVQLFLTEAAEAGLIPQKPDVVFAG